MKTVTEIVMKKVPIIVMIYSLFVGKRGIQEPVSTIHLTNHSLIFDNFVGLRDDNGRLQKHIGTQ
jgi:hypothetical protein